MSEMQDGGLAFPRSPHSGEQCDDGMTLRDYFAAKAPFTLGDAVLAADLESQAPSVEVATYRVLMDPEKRAIAMAMLAALRCEYADAMLKARSV